MDWLSRFSIFVFCMIAAGAAAGADHLPPNANLTPNQKIVSANGQYQAVYQGDGNFVVYGPKGPLWASGTHGKRSNVLVMQGDGNLVIYDGNRPVWASGSARGKPGRLVMQNDGNLVIYQDGGGAIWASNTAGGVSVLGPGDTLATNATMSRNQQIVSANGQYRAIYQGDGNFVVYGPKAALWSSETHGKPGNVLVMQGDGNLVIYDGNRPVWASGSARGKPGRLVMQNDGNLVIYQEGGGAIWASNTAGGVPAFKPSDTLPANVSLAPNQKIVSRNGQYQAIYQGDGNFVVYGPRGALWASGTDGKRGNVLVMQGDGNLVIYDGGRPVWASGSNRGRPARLVMQDDGNLVIYQDGGGAIWASNTAGGGVAARVPVGGAPGNTQGLVLLAPSLEKSLANNPSLIGNAGAGLVGNTGSGLAGGSGGALNNANPLSNVTPLNKPVR